MRQPDSHDHHGDMGGMADMEPGPMMLEHPNDMRWVQPVVMLLGAWLLTSPFMMPYDQRALAIHDVVCGGLAVLIAAVALCKRLAFVSYANAFLGLWLMFAPLVFWTRSPAVFLNQTLLGALLVAFSTLLPMGMSMGGADVPKGWSYNPSSWPQRAPLALLAFVGFVLARHMASFQLGHTSWTWEPFFGDGTSDVLTSDVSKMFPISDAGLGAVTYLVELLAVFMGDRRRWRTMPWMVAMFGIVVVPLGVVSIVLVMMQPMAVGAWCTPCLVSAAAMLIMIPLALDEVVAMLQLMVERRRAGVSYWHTFWFGAKADAADDQPRADRRPAWRLPAMVWGVNAPLPLIMSAVLGSALLFVPAVFGAAGRFSDLNHLVGALAVVVAVIALADVARPARLLNVPLGAALLLGAWIFEGGDTAAQLVTSIAGAALIGLSFPRGRIVESYGSYDRLLAPRGGRRSRWPTRRRGGFAATATR